MYIAGKIAASIQRVYLTHHNYKNRMTAYLMFNCHKVVKISRVVHLHLNKYVYIYIYIYIYVYNIYIIYVYIYKICNVSL